MANFHTYNFPHLTHGDRVTLKVLEIDELMDSFADPSSPTSPASPSPLLPELAPEQVLHTVDLIYQSPNQSQCPNSKDIDYDNISVHLTLNGEYDIHISIESEIYDTVHICENFLIHFERDPVELLSISLPSASYVPPIPIPIPISTQSIKSPTFPPTPPPTTPSTPVFVPISVPVAPPSPPLQPSTAIPIKAPTQTNLSSVDLIHGKPASWWCVSNWEEVNDPTMGFFYKNKITGETTLYYDDFDLDSQ